MWSFNLMLRWGIHRLWYLILTDKHTKRIRQHLQTAADCYNFPGCLINSFISAEMTLIRLPEEGWAPVAINLNCVSAHVGRHTAVCLQGRQRNIWFRINGCFHSHTIGKVVTQHEVCLQAALWLRVCVHVCVCVCLCLAYIFVCERVVVEWCIFDEEEQGHCGGSLHI